MGGVAGGNGHVPIPLPYQGVSDAFFPYWQVRTPPPVPGRQCSVPAAAASRKRVQLAYWHCGRLGNAGFELRKF